MKRAAVIGIVVASALVVGGAGAAWFLMTRPPSAEDAARTYLSALSEGDIDTIMSMRDDRLDDDGERILSAAFTDAGFVEDATIDRMREGQDGAVAVDATASIDGERVDVSFRLARGGDGAWVLGGDYLASATVEAQLEGGAALPAVWIGDALVPTGQTVALLPAAYVAAAAPRSIVEGETEVAVGAGAPVEIEVTASLTPDATGRAQEQLDAYAQACAEPATAVPDNCGLVVPWAADLAELERIAFRIEGLPAVTLSPDAASFAATGGIIVATATGRTREGTPGAFTYRADDWSLRGTLRLSGDEMLLTVH
ncbi:hypothetical protein [Microbacterium yannicii]|uniref:hypothetical protein n=1 Tax=Microbacterium yannicii TaxID=671622 RepID=UPI0003651129|nr:hypothetical protein [Microbacterium yannicii]